MKGIVRKGLHEIRTRSSLTSELENPQRKYLRAAGLELKKSLCRKVRDAARARTEEMDREIADLQQQQARLLAAAGVSAAGQTDLPGGSLPADGAGAGPPGGFSLKY
jgi:hypothetical protein